MAAEAVSVGTVDIGGLLSDLAHGQKPKTKAGRTYPIWVEPARSGAQPQEILRVDSIPNRG